jgi:hypothetical protein
MERVLLPMTPVRRRVVTRVNSGDVGTSAGVMSSGAGASSSATVGRSSGASGDDAGAGAQDPSVMPTTMTTSKKRTLSKPGKGKGRARNAVSESDTELSTVDDNDNDSDFVLGASSPTLPNSKRQKTIPTGELRSPFRTAEPLAQSTVSRRAVRTPRAAANRNPLASSTARMRMGTLLREEASREHRGQRETSIQELLEQAGVDTPANPYQEHLLSRYEPVLNDPVIGDAPRVRRDIHARPSPGQIHQNFQDKAHEQLSVERAVRGAREKTGLGEVNHVSTSHPNDHRAYYSPASQFPNPKLVISAWVDSQGAEFRETYATNEGARKIFEGNLFAAVFGLLGRYNASVPAGYSQIMQLTPEHTLDHLNQAQKGELVQLITLAADATFKTLKPPASHSMASTATPRKQAKAGELGSTRKMPPTGMFTVTPSRHRSRSHFCRCSSPTGVTFASSPPPTSHLTQTGDNAGTVEESIESPTAIGPVPGSSGTSQVHYSNGRYPGFSTVTGDVSSTTLISKSEKEMTATEGMAKQSADLKLEQDSGDSV